MTEEERKLTIEYLEEMKEEYIEGDVYERYPLPEWFALDKAIEALEQDSILDKIRAEIQKLRNCSCSCSDGIIDDVEDIIDKYKAESEMDV